MFTLFRFLGNKRLFILLFSLIFFIGVMGISFLKRESPTWPEKFISDTIGWTQGLVYKPVSAVAGFFSNVSQIGDWYEENKVLKQTLAHYAKDVARLNALESENERLKEALAFTERQKSKDDYTYRIARVVATSPDAYNRSIKIDLGEKDGIKENMAVMTPQGLIGIINRVFPFHSNVQLITDLNNQSIRLKGISATVRGKEGSSFGIIENYDKEENKLLMTKIKTEDTLEENDIVVTSGKGGIYPEGIEIGVVKSRNVGEFGLTHTAQIEPSADFQHLTEVFIIEMPDVLGE
ncbi:rod shape-determining protein MreC [Marinicrinis sediminis]|uniref:Cell shape-determining protein MreC n=1 Tax=Marinicrinis sediminis TaxID=1652465 RepID=A0ABW5R687_9BACL